MRRRRRIRGNMANFLYTGDVGVGTVLSWEYVRNWMEGAIIPRPYSRTGHHILINILQSIYCLHT
jgi:hypothetical protein